VLAASLLAFWGVWRWARVVFSPANTAKVLAAKRPIGNHSDLYVRWLGTRELLLHRRDPYSVEITREGQIGFYGRPLDRNNPADPVEQESFVYPLYVVFLLAPLAGLSFPAMAEIFRWLLLASIAISVPLWMWAIGLRSKWWLVLSGMLLAAGSYPAVEEFFQQNLTALVILFLAAAAAAAVGNWLTLCGFLLAVATAKPDTTGLLVAWFLFWAIAEWRQRWRLIASFAATMGILLMAAQALSPGWIGRFIAAVREYPTYNQESSVLSVLLPGPVAKLAIAGLIACLIVAWWRWRRAPAGSTDFAMALAWGCAVTLVVLPKLAAYNQLLLVPVVLLLIHRYEEAIQHNIFARAFTKAAFLCLLWQWLAAVALSIWSLLTSPALLRGTADAPLYTLLALPPLATLAVAAMTWSGSITGRKRATFYSTNP